MVSNVILGGGGGGGGVVIFYVCHDNVIEVPSESEQKEPAEVDTLPSQLQSPPNLSALALIHCNFHTVDHLCKLSSLWGKNPRRMTGAN